MIPGMEAHLDLLSETATEALVFLIALVFSPWIGLRIAFAARDLSAPTLACGAADTGPTSWHS
jgi:hypothetical protein